MIELENGAYRADEGDYEEWGLGVADLPSGESPAIFDSQRFAGWPEDAPVWYTVGLYADKITDDKRQCCFSTFINYTDWKADRDWTYQSWANFPSDDDVDVALRAEEEQTEIFSNIVKELKAGRDLKGVAERYGLELINSNHPL